MGIRSPYGRDFAHFSPRSGLLTYFMDDLLLCFKAWSHHLQLLEEKFKALLAVGLTLKLRKAQFGRSEVKYLRYVISKDGVKIGTEDRIQAILALPQPTTIKELRSVLGAVKLESKYIPRLSKVVDPLIALTYKDVAQYRVLRKFWKAEHTRAFLTVKYLLANAPVLHFPNMALEFIVHSDASDKGTGAMLTQKHGSAEVIVAHVSKRYSTSEQHYRATAK